MLSQSRMHVAQNDLGFAAQARVRYCIGSLSLVLLQNMGFALASLLTTLFARQTAQNSAICMILESWRTIGLEYLTAAPPFTYAYAAPPFMSYKEASQSVQLSMLHKLTLREKRRTLLTFARARRPSRKFDRQKIRSTDVLKQNGGGISLSFQALIGYQCAGRQGLHDWYTPRTDDTLSERVKVH